MVEIGKTYSLEVVKDTDFGFFLDADNLGEILLPGKHAPDNLSVNQAIDVFLYLDSQDRPIATTQFPKAEVGQFAYLEVKANTEIGAFLDWGLDKDILVPFSEQHRPLTVGKSYLVFLYLDNQNRITATAKIDKVVREDGEHNFHSQQPVDLIIGNSTELGFKAIVEHSHWGLLYKTEVDQRLSFGQSIRGYIKQIREDGKIDLSLKSSQELRDDQSQIVHDYLRDHDGFVPLHDKSPPARISELLGMSKGQFKRAVGGLYKRKIIAIEENGIRLV